MGLYEVTAEGIKAAMRCELVDEADLWGSDEALWQRLTSAEHSEVRRWVDLISPGTRFTWNEEQPVFRLSTKVRSIDPPVTGGDSVTPLSALDLTFAQYRNEYLTSKQGQWPMGVVPAPGAIA